MASVTYGNKIYGLNDIKITNTAGTTQEDLGTSVTADLVPEVQGGKLQGDDAVTAVLSYIIGADLTFSSGEYSSAAVAIMTGITLSTSGSSPNEVTELQVNQATRLPYFKVYARALDEESGDMHVLIYRCKLMAMPGIAKLENGSWRMNEFEAYCIDDGTNGIFAVLQNETAATLPTS